MARLRAPERRRQLLEVAAELFAERGYYGTTTAELAAGAGIAEPILYRHFDNKLDLFVTLIDEVGQEVIGAWRERLAHVEDPDERLRILLDGNPATHARGRGVYRVIFQAMTEVETEPPIGRALRRHIKMLHEFLRSELAELQHAGIVRDDEPAAALAELLIDVGVGSGMMAPLGGAAQPQPLGQKSLQRLIAELLRADS